MTGARLVRCPGLAAAAGLLAATALAGQGAWTNNGPPVEITSLAVSATGTVFAGGRDGLYRSVDHGETWSRVGPPFPPASFGAPALAVDPTSGNTLYIGLQGGNGVFKSTDGGQTRVRLSAGLLAYPEPVRLVVAPSDPSTIYLLGHGIFRSIDAGASWVQLPFQHYAYALAVHPADARRIVVGTLWGDPTEANVWLSDDGGQSWRFADTGSHSLVRDLAIDPRNPRRVYAAMSDLRDRALARSDDGGDTWVRSGQGFLGYGATSLAIDPAAPDVLYATGHGGPIAEGVIPPDDAGVYRSPDGALSWSHVRGGQRPATDMLAIDPSGLWIYTAGIGVSVYQVGHLRLLGDRFLVTLSAMDPRTGMTAGGVPTPLGVGGRAGYFSLPAFTGDPTFPEVTVKMVDATGSPALGGGFWFFHAPLTDVRYTLTVTDQRTGAVKMYSNGPSGPGQLCGGADTSAFPP